MPLGPFPPASSWLKPPQCRGLCCFDRVLTASLPAADLCPRHHSPILHCRFARLLRLRHLAQQGEPAGAAAPARHRPVRGVPQRQPGGEGAGGAAQPPAPRRAAGHRQRGLQEMIPKGRGHLVMGASDPPHGEARDPLSSARSFSSRATRAALGLWLHPEMSRVLVLPHQLPAEHRGGLACPPPHLQRSGTGAPPLPALLTRSRILPLRTPRRQTADLSAHPGMQSCAEGCRGSPETGAGSPALPILGLILAAVWDLVEPPASC